MDEKIEFISFLISNGIKKEEAQLMADQLEREILAIEQKIKEKNHSHSPLHNPRRGSKRRRN